MKYHRNNCVSYLLVVGLCIGSFWWGGCDFHFPLDSPSIPIDNELCGRWENISSNVGANEVLLVLPLSEREYLIHYPVTRENSLYGKAWLVGLNEKDKLIQIEWIGSSSGDIETYKQNKLKYQLLSYTKNNRKIFIKLINPDFTKNKANNPLELKAIIKENFSNTALYRDVIVFRKVNN